MNKTNAFGKEVLRMKPLCVGVALAVHGFAMAQQAPAPAEEAATLPAVKVQAQADRETTEGTGSYKGGRSSTATPLKLTPRETPQAVSVVTQQQIVDQGLQTVTDVLNNVAGVYVNQYEQTRAQFTARGFNINTLLIDGLPTTWDQAWSSGEILTSIAMYDRVEVVRGANGLTTGVGDPGAAINLVRKRATSHELTGTAEVELGNWNHRRVMADVSTPINKSGTVRGRVVGEYTDRDSFIEGYSRRDQILFATVEADITDATLLTAGINQQDTKTRGQMWGALPVWYSNGERTNWDRSKTSSADWVRADNTTDNYYVSLDQQFNNGWNVKATVNRTEREADSYLLYLFGAPSKVDGTGMFGGGGSYLVDRTQTDIGLQAGGPFRLFGREHTASVGLISQKQDFDAQTRGYIPVNTGDFNNWDRSVAEPAWNALSPSDGAVTKQKAVYAATRLNVTDPLKVILGARVTDYEKTATLTGERLEQSGEVTPYAGVVFDVTKQLSLYGSYTSIFQPQAERDVNARTLDPVVGKSFEVGSKGEFLDGRLNGSLAIFQIKQDNVAVATGERVTGFPLETAYTTANGVTSTGFELEASGQLAQGWNLSASYAQFRAKTEEGGDVNTIYPRKTLRLFTTYRVPTLAGLTLGGGVNWQDDIYTVATNPLGNLERVEQGGYALVNVMARYDITTNLSAQLNINNLFDKTYYTMFDAFDQMTYGTPRNSTLRLTYKF